MRRRGLLLAALAAPGLSWRAEAQTTPANTDGDSTSNTIRDLLTARTQPGADSLGYVAGIVDGGVKRLVTAGESGAANGRALDGSTIFEIGSITKVFTALLLADAVQRGEMAFSDPLTKYLPPDVQLHAFDGKAITLLDLVTYTSGLPRMPGNIVSKDKQNPYADYTTAQLYEAVSAITPLFYPGSHYEYANLGFGLLGQILSLHLGRSYEDLVVSRICGPLGLDDTRITLTPGMQARLAPGHDGAWRTVSNWDLLAVAGAGALRSTANDLLRFVDACSGRMQTPLTNAAASLLEVRRQTDINNQYAAAGWFVRTQYGDELVWKDGDTGGYSTFIAFSTRAPRAAVLLSNTSAPFTTPEIGKHLVNPAFPLPALHRTVAIDPADLAAYAGRYAISPRFVLTIRPGDGHLLVQATDQAELDMFPESKTQFFCRAVDAQLTFQLDPDGHASGLVLHQNRRNLRAPRLP
jgi:D-alanyl-D-alanine-carboxypeptidase/D-alanyl-D-alanine-endopeptidase